MSAVMEPVARYQDLLERLRASDLPGAGVEWLEEKRSQARSRFKLLAFPGRSSEAWRYTSLQGLLEQDFVPAQSLDAYHDLNSGEMLIPGLDAWRLTFVNGRFAPGLSTLQGLPVGSQLESLRGVLHAGEENLGATLGSSEERLGNVLSAFNTASFADGVYLRVGPGTRLDRPVEILQLSTAGDQPRIAQPRHLIRIEKGASAYVIERHLSLGDSRYFNNSVMEIQLDAEAELRHRVLQQEGPQAYHMNSRFVHQAAGSSYRSIDVALGGAWSRNDIHVALVGEGAQADLRGLYLVGDAQLSDYHLDVRHAVPGCASREDFRGVLNGRGRGVFDGRILVEREAQKTDAHLSNANLLLSRQAEIDTKPQLEIFADDVKCSHGTTVGQIEEDALFYLRSRGIPQAQARQMICLGFARAAFENSGNDALDGYLESEVAKRLGAEVTG